MPKRSSASDSSSPDRGAVAHALYREAGSAAASRRCGINQRFGELDLASDILQRLQLRRGEVLVDVGCGTGEHLQRFAGAVQPGGRAVGIDSSAAAVAVTRRRRLAGVVADSRALPLRDGIADAVTCIFAVYYFADLARSVDELARVLRPGGRIVVCGPAADSNAELYAFHRRATGCDPSDADRMALGYVGQAVAAAVRRLDFENVTCETLTNRVLFPDAAVFLDYWSATSLFQRTPTARVAAGREQLATHDGPFVVTKRIEVLAARRAGRGSRPRSSGRQGRVSEVRATADVLVLGGGVAGLAAAGALGDRALLLERDDRPGGLVRTERFGAFWFDRVIHLLYFDDPGTERHIRALLGDVLEPCTPTAWVETAAGTARFPLQLHLAGLAPRTIARCLDDLDRVHAEAEAPPARNFEALLQRTFGSELCELFFFPYNRKLWKRPLDGLAPTGFQWNIARPNLQDVRRGAAGECTTAYNADGWYPRPPRGAARRGMEVLSHALAERVPRLLLGHEVVAIDLDRQLVRTRTRNGAHVFRYAEACVSTLPLAATVLACEQAPADLQNACRRLVCNRVLSAALSIRGPRPRERGHWRYYPDETLIFNRLVHLHEFDPDAAPRDGWPLLVEITEPAESPASDPQRILQRVHHDLRRAGALPRGSKVIDARLIVVDPAYVVFTLESAAIVRAALDFLRAHGIEPLGRYGRWEYSSMAQVVRDGRVWASRSVPEGEAV